MSCERWERQIKTFRWMENDSHPVITGWIYVCIELLWYGDKLHEKWLQTISIYHFSLEYENTCETVDSMLWLMMCSKVIKLKVESISAKRRIRYGYYKYREGSEWAGGRAGKQANERTSEWVTRLMSFGRKKKESTCQPVLCANVSD